MNLSIFKTKKELQIQSDQQGYDVLVKSVNAPIECIKDARDEFKRNKIEIKTLEELSKGNFIEILNQYVDAEYKKSTTVKDLKLSPEDFKERRKIETSKLESLQSIYNNLINRNEQLYDFNDGFFKHCENAYHSKDPYKQKIFKKAPKKRDYRIGDMFTITGNKVKLDIPKKPFEMYLLNNEQKELIVSINKFIEASKELEFEPKFIYDAVKKYLASDTGYLLNNVVFNYNEILTHKL
ncbi:hypothetical protein [Psychroflexus salis]|uniref:Uncharacterized protein n=1 Tax=Psychroflexus salis TaxID=1526574 RepID=A0A916ZT87_9FLAO|nr:hypothetical protein [Psychroflexus salis]GGE12024.1 hypothetical protein GCM10010831_11830 [Psychroflexus salis]